MNVSGAVLLCRHRRAGENTRSTFGCPPDTLAGAIVAVLFLRSAVSVIGEAWPAFGAAAHPAHDLPG